MININVVQNWCPLTELCGLVYTPTRGNQAMYRQCVEPKIRVLIAKSLQSVRGYVDTIKCCVSEFSLHDDISKLKIGQGNVSSLR